MPVKRIPKTAKPPRKPLAKNHPAGVVGMVAKHEQDPARMKRWQENAQRLMEEARESNEHLAKLKGAVQSATVLMIEGFTMHAGETKLHPRMMSMLAAWEIMAAVVKSQRAAGISKEAFLRTASDIWIETKERHHA